MSSAAAIILFLWLKVERAKVLSNTVKQKRKEKAGKWEVPLPKVLSLSRPHCCNLTMNAAALLLL